MNLSEFNNLSLQEKRLFIYGLQGNNPCKFISYRKELGQTISLWDCGSFFAEMYATDKKAIKIEGIDLNSSRLDYYIDYAKTQGARTK